MADIKYDLELSAPTIAQFCLSKSFGRILMGPVGSGKTTGCILDLFMKARAQAKAPDGLRYTRFAVVRQTLKQLKDTVVKDCETILSTPGLGRWKVSESVFHLNFDDVRSEWFFIPLEDATDQARLLSMQLTGAWLSECIEMNLDVVTPVTGRLGRYPAGARGTPTWSGIIADTNSPTEMTPWHTFMTNLPPDWQLFHQPSGLSPQAENLSFLEQTEESVKFPVGHPAREAQGRKYYERPVAFWGIDHDWVKRYVKSEYGDDPSGAAVFKESFRPNFHIVEDTLPIPGYPLLVGQDFGRNPWSLVCQMDHMGRLLVHKEVGATNIGLDKHVKERLVPTLVNQFTGYRVVLIGDPSGVAKGSVSEESMFDALKRLGLAAFPAPTNDVEKRIMAVEALLARQTNGGPSLIISRQGCPLLCRAMAGGYRFKKTRDGALKPKPNKDDVEGFSHVVDDLQYVSLIVHGGLTDYVAQHIWGRKQRKRQTPTSAAWT
jgi:hypothetical protein